VLAFDPIGPGSVRAFGMKLAVAAAVLLFLPLGALYAIETVALGVGVDPQTPRPRLSTLPTGSFVPGEIIVKYSRLPDGAFAPAVPPALVVGEFLTERLEGAAVSRRPLLAPLQPDLVQGDQRALLIEHEERREQYGLTDVDVFELPAASDVRSLCQALEQLAEVEYARPNYTFPLQFVPDDPFYASSDSWGQGYDDLYGPKLLQCEQAWDMTQGAGVVVAVVDSGVDYTHPDLAANMWINPLEDTNGNGTYEPWPSSEERDGVFGDQDGEDNDGNGYVDDVVGYDFVGDGFSADADPMDTFGHGSHVAGTIAAVGNNGIGVVGIAPQARLMALKVSQDNSGGVSTVAATEALAYAVENGATVGNHSWGGFGNASLVPTLAAAFDMAFDEGMVNVVAAGNSNADASVTVPASFASTIAVAATDHTDRKAGFSNYGLTVDVSAPGGGETEPSDVYKPANSILSVAGAGTILAELYDGALLVGGEYLRLAGTSMASPHVAGVAALIRAYYPSDTPDDVRGRLKAGADSIDAVNPDWLGQLGAGRINAYASLTLAPQPYLELVAVTPQGLVAPGSAFDLVVAVRNDWQPAADVQLTLSSLNALVEVDPATATIGALATGQVAENVDSPFGVYVDPSISYGEVLPFELLMSYAGGSATAHFSIPTKLFQNVIYQTGLPSSGLSSITMCMEDTNDDLRPDLLQTRIFQSAQYYKGRADGVFVNRPLPMDVNSTIGLRIADLDGDGQKDLLVPGNVPGQTFSKVIFRQIAAHQFEADVPAGEFQNSGSSVHLGLDYNGDGLVDLLALGGFRLRLFRNDGGMSFTEVTDAALPDMLYNGQTFNDAVLADYDNDGFADVIATGGARGLFILRNRGDGTFEYATPYTNVPLVQAQDLALGDFDNDGYMDIFAGDDPGSGPANRLLHNNGDGTFSDITEEAGAVYEVDPANRPAAYRGSEAFDFDNDGWLDIFVQCGDNDASPTARLYRNTGIGTFTDETATHISLPSGVRYTATYDDYDADGDVDIYLSDSLFGTAGFFRNFATSLAAPNHWVRISLEGTQSNYRALGARVTVRAGGLTQIRDVTHGEIASQPVHFGLGDADNIDEVIIRWPSGMVQRHINQPVDTTLHFIEGTFGRGDTDGDGDLDLNDFATFVVCFGSTNPDCLRIFDYNSDGGIDLNDFSTFAVAYTSSTYMLVDAGPSHTVYVNRGAQFLYPAVSGGRAPYTYEWSPPDDLTDPNSPTPLASPLETRVYTLTVTDADGQSVSDSLLVRVLPMAVEVGDDHYIYDGQSVGLPVPEVFGGIPPYTYSWSPAEGLSDAGVPAPTASPAATTEYTLTVTDSSATPRQATDSVRVLVDALFPLADMSDGARGVTILGVEDRSDFGSAVAIGDVDGDNAADAIIGAPLADATDTDSGAAYVVFGGAAAISAGTIDVATLDGTAGFAIAGLAARDYLGAGVAVLGDVNDDGVDDFAVSATGADNIVTDNGAVYVIFGGAGLGAGGSIDLSALDGTNGFTIIGLGDDVGLGWSVSPAGDINNDGIDDFVVSAPAATYADVSVGAAYVIFGGASIGSTGYVPLASLDGTDGFAFFGTHDGDFVGSSVAAVEDFSGDGINDLIIGAYSVDRTLPPPDDHVVVANCGAAYVVFGGAGVGAGGSMQAVDLDGTNGLVILGFREQELAGFSVASPGDFNGDGHSDVVLGAPYSDVGGNNAGLLYMVYGGPTVGAGGLLDLLDLHAADGFVMRGEANGDYAAYSLGTGGDVNSDGAPDLLVGVPNKDTNVFEPGTGSAYVLYGQSGTGTDGIADFSEIDGPNGFEIRGIDVIDSAGASVSGGADFDGDGVVDIIVGAGNASRGDIRPGAAYIVFGFD
jgi:subtilisin family serine protease